MHLTILALGARGDVVPYLALGLGLREVGHEVTLAAYADFEEEIRGRGLGFRPVAGGVREVPGGAGEAGGARVEEAGNNPVRLVKHLSRVLAPLMEEFFSDCLAACRASDAIVSSPIGFFGGYDVAEFLRVPFLPAYLQPVHPTRFFSRASPSPRRRVGYRSWAPTTSLPTTSERRASGSF